MTKREFLLFMALFVTVRAVCAASTEELVVRQMSEIQSAAASNANFPPCPDAEYDQSTTSCPNWETEFSESQKSLSSYRDSIENAFRARNGGIAPGCGKFNETAKKSAAKFDLSRVNGRVGEVSVDSIPELKASAAHLSKIQYTVVPPGIPPAAGEKPKTIFQFAGGPGGVLSENPSQFQRYQTIIVDYIGMGQNKVQTIRPGIDDQIMNLNVYAKAVERIVRKEKDEHNMGDYILFGHSFGSVGANVVGSRLSKIPDAEAKYRPSAVVLSGVIAFEDARGRPSKQGSKNLAVEWLPKITSKRTCVLPMGEKCFDDRVLNLLPSEERGIVARKIQALYQGADREHLSPVQSLFRDAFHLEASTRSEQAVEFLRKYFLGEPQTGLYCWYLKNFNGIPWLNRETSPSLMASVRSHNCLAYPDSSKCKCFKHQSVYRSNYQISSPVRVIYVNGDSDTQTPVEGAKKHFALQQNANKFFLEVCRGGHRLYSSDGEPGTVNPDRVFDAAIDKNPAEALMALKVSCP